MKLDLGLGNSEIFDVLEYPSSIILYEGDQPSINDYVANFSSNYASAGTKTLQIYDVRSSGFLRGSRIYGNRSGPNGSVYTNAVIGRRLKMESDPNIPKSKQSIKSGTASWAVFYYSSGDQTLFPSTISIDDRFIIVPVSNVEGLGILKLRNTALVYSTSSSDNLIVDCVIDITTG